MIMRVFFIIPILFCTFQSVWAAKTVGHSLSVGAGVGLEQSRFSVNVVEGDPVGNTTLRRFDIAKRTGVGLLSAGYGFHWGKMMLGAEIGLGFGDGRKTVDPSALADGTDSRLTTAGSRWFWGAHAKLGYRALPNVTPYVGLGIERRSLTYKYIVQDVPSQSIDASRTQIAPSYHLGLEFDVSQQFLIGVEYRASSYQSNTQKASATQVKFQPKNFDTLFLHVRYRFDVPRMSQKR